MNTTSFAFITFIIIPNFHQIQVLDTEIIQSRIVNIMKMMDLAHF